MKRNLFLWWKQIRLGGKLVYSYARVNWKFFLLGILASIIAITAAPFVLSQTQGRQRRVIGLVGNFTVSSLPASIQSEISLGLTKLTPEGTATSAAATSWEATDEGRLVTFTLDNTLRWQDGQQLTSADINYNLKSVELVRSDGNHISFRFKNPFAPLPTIVAQPLFKDGLVGLGDNPVESLKFNGRFLSNLVLKSQTSGAEKEYKFYSREDSLVTALKLGSVRQATDLYKTHNFQDDNHYQITGRIAALTIATLFFNTQNDALSDRTIRQTLTYALPNDYSQGERAYSPFPKGSWVGPAGIKKYPQSLDTARKTLEKRANDSGQLTITLNTSENLLDVANTIAAAWQQAGVTVKVTVADILPETYAAYLTYLEVPPDPDQYLLWHSTQVGNITHFKSPKIDKLLEDGRKTLDMDERQNIYQNFQKAITEEVPAVFLFYPRLYTVTRK